jgi:hypothetical protein
MSFADRREKSLAEAGRWVKGGTVLSSFQLSPSCARDSSQGLRESPAISVLTVRKIQHTQIGSVPVVLSVAFLFFRKE